MSRSAADLDIDASAPTRKPPSNMTQAAPMASSHLVVPVAQPGGPADRTRGAATASNTDPGGQAAGWKVLASTVNTGSSLAHSACGADQYSA